MSEDYLGAMPKLYNAPAYSRPPRAIVIDRPFDPDDLPLEAHRSAQDRAFLAAMGGAVEADQAEDTGSRIRRALQPFGRRDTIPAESGG